MVVGVIVVVAVTVAVRAVKRRKERDAELRTAHVGLSSVSEG